MIKPLKIFMAAFLLLVSSVSVNAQDQMLRFQNLSIKDGLSHSIIFSICQDKKGFIWFGTGDGLNRYDGYQVTVYKNDPKDLSSISGNLIFSIFEDSKGNLWVGTSAGGLNLYDRNNDRFICYSNNPASAIVLHNNLVHSIVEDSDGNLWLGTGDGIAFLDLKNKKAEYFSPGKIKSSKERGVNALCLDKNNNLWVGFSGGGLCMFDRKKKEFILYQHAQENSASLSDDDVYSIYKDTKGNMWIGTSSGVLNLFNPDLGAFKKFYPDPADFTETLIIRAICEDENGNLLLGTRNGLYIFNRETNRFAHYVHDPNNLESLEQNSIQAIYRDKKGDIWIGTRGGVSYLNMDIHIFKHYRAGPKDTRFLNNQVVYSILEDRHGDLWFGTEEGGLNRLNRKTGKFTYYVHDKKNPNSISSVNIKKIVEDKLGNLWIATYYGGLNYFDRKANRFIHHKHNIKNSNSLWDDRVINLLIDKEDDLWICTENNGIDMYSSRNKKFKHLFQEKNIEKLGRCRVITQDCQGKFWLGFESSTIGWYDKKTESFNTNRLNDKGAIRVIFEDQKDNLWVGTISRGLFLLNKEGKTIKVYTEKDGLPSNIIYGILQDSSGNLWLSTSNGLSEFNPATGEFRNYVEENGLQSNMFNYNAYMRARDGEMYFGGINGVTAFYPKNVHKNTYVPPVVITDFKIFNMPVEIGGKTDVLKQQISEAKEITLSYRQNVFSLEFVSLNYASSEQNRYAYMMEGFENKWNYVSAKNRTVSYTNLDPGEYTFKVKGSNNDGVWNDSGASLRVTIIPPFWKTAWFYVISGTSILIIVIGAYRLRVRQLVKHKEELTKSVDEALAKIKVLNGLIPICANCKKIRDDKGYWNQLEHYINEHSEATFSHGVCPECAEKLYGEIFENLNKQKEAEFSQSLSTYPPKKEHTSSGSSNTKINDGPPQ